MQATINFHLRGSIKQEDCQQIIYLRITINRVSKAYSAGINVSAKNWDRKKQRIIRKDIEHSHKNDLIEKKYFKAKDVLYKLTMSNTPVTFTNFETGYFEKTNFKNSLLVDFMKFFIEEKKSVFEKTTIKRYNNCLEKIIKFSPGILLQEIDYNFVNNFDIYLRNQLKNQHNTVAKEIKIIKAIFAESQRRGFVDQGKKLNYSINYKDVEKDFLTIDELKLLSGLIDKDVSRCIKKVLYYFVFSCFTGLRISDIEKLKIIDFKDHFRYLDIVTQKTKDRLILPLSKPSRALIYKYMDFEKKRFESPFPGLPFFNSFSEQYGRSVLKIAYGLVGIDKQISFHSARYTFATICNTLNIPIEVTSKLLSHKSLKMTLKYAKFSDKLLSENINKWDNILS